MANAADDMVLERRAVELKPSAQFRVPKRQYNLQYAQLYYQRLATLRPVVLAAAARQWGAHAKHVGKVLDVAVGERCYVIGTVYVDMPLKPNILDEISSERYTAHQPARPKYVSDKDKTVLEDDSGRLSLTGDKLDGALLCTGVVAAVLGEQQAGGEFLVVDIVFAGMPAQPALPLATPEVYVALVSGFQLGHRSLPNALPTHLVVDWLNGELGTAADQTLSASIVHVVIAGNLLWTDPDDEERTATSTTTGKRGQLDPSGRAAEALLQADQRRGVPAQLLSELCTHVPVDLMPGDHDPANYLLPQQPLFRGLFPVASTLSTLSPVTNPHAFTINGVSFLGGSGQTLDDLYRYNREEDRMRLLEQTLHWRHLAPSAPDTLGAFPMFDHDPFILPTETASCPHVYFMGNQPEYGTRLVQGPSGQQVRLVLLPAFARQPTMVLVNLRTLHVRPVTFSMWPVATDA